MSTFLDQRIWGVRFSFDGSILSGSASGEYLDVLENGSGLMIRAFFFQSPTSSMDGRGSWSSTDHPMRSHSYQVGVHWSCPSRDFQWHNSICWKGLVSIKGGVDVVIPCLWCRLYYDMFSLDKFLEWTMNNFTLLAVVLLRALPMVSKHSSM